MFIRGREREAEVWQRFHFAVEGFVASEQAGLFEARITANAGWAIDLFLALSERLSPRIHVALDDVRSGRHWKHDDLPLSRVRDGIIQLRSVLMTYGGVDLALFDGEDQITLSRHLEIFIYARTDRWFYFLRDLGIKRYRSLSPRSWRLEPHEFPPAPLLETLLADAVTRLELVPD